MRWGISAAVVMVGCLLLAAPAIAQDDEGGGGQRKAAPSKTTIVKAVRTPTKTVKVEVPIERAERSNTPEFRGEGWFQQKCGVCHLGRWRKTGQLKPFAPTLEGVLKNAAQGREAAVREFIRRGSLNMPGFANAFSPTEFEELIAYLKTL